MPTKSSPSPTYHPGTIIQRALILETTGTALAGLLVLLHPTAFLTFLVSSPSSAITPLAIGLTQWIAVLSFAFSIACAFSIPDTARAVQSRWGLYWTLGLGEAAMCVLFLWQMGREGEVGLSREGLWMGVLQLGGAVLWRGFVIVFKPHWFGGREKGKGE